MVFQLPAIESANLQTNVPKALIQRFKEKRSDGWRALKSARTNQAKETNVNKQFVEEIKALTEQLSSPPGSNSLRA